MLVTLLIRPPTPLASKEDMKTFEKTQIKYTSDQVTRSRISTNAPETSDVDTDWEMYIVNREMYERLGYCLLNVYDYMYTMRPIRIGIAIPSIPDRNTMSIRCRHGRKSTFCSPGVSGVAAPAVNVTGAASRVVVRNTSLTPPGYTTRLYAVSRNVRHK